jgi:hypothetical protein
MSNIKILVRNSDSIVLFHADNMSISETQVEFIRNGKEPKRVIYRELNSNTATIVDVDSIPDDFINGMYTYINGV